LRGYPTGCLRQRPTLVLVFKSWLNKSLWAATPTRFAVNVETGHTDSLSGEQERCLEAGVNEDLTKPIKMRELLSTIQQLLITKVL